ncbi:MAG: DCC1-like thiol-disulfide oxidoreductase family protein [Fuerstiella sp.]|nr:DCC1-like thiol-disulfide oxidoreductase family protein [Fuerstiella sp.]
MPEKATNTADSSEDPVTADRIVFFDGVCGLCNHTVDFLLRRDTKGRLKFAPLQGTTATEVLPSDVRKQLDTMAYYRDGQLYYRSTAVLQVIRDLGGAWGRFATLLLVIPPTVRNFGYRCVSASRYCIFGKQEACRIPTTEERTRFLN